MSVVLNQQGKEQVMDDNLNRGFLCMDESGMLERGWNFQASAAYFWSTRNSFLSTKTGHATPEGEWSIACFPFRKYINTPLSSMTWEQIEDMRAHLRLVLSAHDIRGKYYRIKIAQGCFEKHLVHPPIPLRLGQERFHVNRRAFATRMFLEGKCLNCP